jgi:hypothetical protein
MDRSNHYEAAFEAYLQAHGLGYVAVDETRRSFGGELPVKSLDFIVFGAGGERLVVDVKGRRYPSGPPGKLRYVWKCWAEQEDARSLERWAALAGPSYRGLLVFAYHVRPPAELPPNTPDQFAFRGRQYLFRAVPSADYLRQMRLLSPSWQTVTLPAAVFRSLVRPVHHFTGTGPSAPTPEACWAEP